MSEEKRNRGRPATGRGKDHAFYFPKGKLFIIDRLKALVGRGIYRSLSEAVVDGLDRFLREHFPE